MNPYLPFDEYIPDGEPRVFNDRVYVYGSHDEYGAPIFCVNDYVCYSAPIDHLDDWRYEGVIYRRNDDPGNRLGLRCLFAPDCVQGKDGRYYLYYAFDFLGRIGVAVSDHPVGPFTYLGNIRFPDGHVLGTRNGDRFCFDPGVLVDDDGRTYLYSGFAIDVPRIATRGHRLLSEGCVAMELDSDMTTILRGPMLVLPRKGMPGAIEDHAFFEASSIRKKDGKYILVYSSEHNHELCYCEAEDPFGPFSFKGTLVDIGDVFLSGRQEKDALNYLGNTHGGLLHIKDDWYIFYHRQTNCSSYARQACMEKLEMDENGDFLQAGITSSGISDAFGKGRIEARTACHLFSKDGAGRYDRKDRRTYFRKHPYFKQEKRQFIANFRDGSVGGFRYIDFTSIKHADVELRGKAKGRLVFACDPTILNPVGSMYLYVDSHTWIKRTTVIFPQGIGALYIRFEGEGIVDLLSLTLS